MFAFVSHTPPAADRRAAFSLVEVTLALGIAAFCLVLLFGLLPTGLNIIQKGVEEAAAVDRASALLGDVRTTPLTNASTARYGMEITEPTASASEPLKEILLDDQGGKLASGASSGQVRYRVGYRVQYPREPAPPAGSRPKTRVYLRVTWPGPAPASQAQGMVEVSVSVDRYE